MSLRQFVFASFFLAFPLLGLANDRPAADTDYHESTTADFGVWLDPAIWKLAKHPSDLFNIEFASPEGKALGSLACSAKQAPVDKIALSLLQGMRRIAPSASIVDQSECELAGHKVLRFSIAAKNAEHSIVAYFELYTGPEGIANLSVSVDAKYLDKYNKKVIGDLFDGLQIGKPGAQQSAPAVAAASATSSTAASAASDSASVLTAQQVADMNASVPYVNLTKERAAFDQVLKGNTTEGLPALEAMAKTGDGLAEMYLADLLMRGTYIPADHARALGLINDAAAKCPDAQWVLGAWLAEGNFLPKDEKRSTALIQKSAAQGYAKAETAMGTFLLHTDPKSAVEWYRKAALQGEPTGEANLGVCYMNGNGVEKDPVQAMTWLRSAAAKGVPKAQLFVARADIDGTMLNPDPQEGIKYVRSLAASGDVQAQRLYATCLWSGSSVAPDRQEALEWFRKAADQGDPGSEDFLGQVYAQGSLVPKDMGQAIAWFQKGAAAGYANSQFRLGLIYRQGAADIPKDLPTAFDLLQNAATQGSIPAATALARLCFIGYPGRPPDYAQAAQWAQKAADAGDAGGEFLLANSYMAGNGVPKDANKAVELLTEAAGKGVPDAQVELARCYDLGQGVPKDVSKEFDLLQKSAGRGRPDAEFYLGVCYAQGKGTTADQAEAAKWFKFSALQGDPRGENAYGYFLAMGTGVKADLVEAYKWFVLASGQDKYAEAKSRANVNMLTFAPKMTLDEMSEARKRAKEFVPVREETPQAVDPFSIGVS